MINVFIRNSRCLIYTIYLSFFTVSSYGNKIYTLLHTKSTMSYIIIDNIVDNYILQQTVYTYHYHTLCVCTQLTRSIIHVRNINIMCNFLIPWTIRSDFFFIIVYSTTAVIFITLFSSRLDFKFNYSCFFRRSNALPRLWFS